MADAVQDETSVMVTNAAGFAPGQFVLLDEDDYSTAAWMPLPNRARRHDEFHDLGLRSHRISAAQSL